MSFLNSLKLSTKSPRQQIMPLVRKRACLLKDIDLQIEAAKAELRGEVFLQEITRWMEVAPGKRELRTYQISVRHWWWKDRSGDDQIMFSTRIDNRILELADGKPSIVVGDLQKLPEILQTLKKAIKAGELDQQLEKMIVLL